MLTVTVLWILAKCCCESSHLIRCLFFNSPHFCHCSHRLHRTPADSQIIMLIVLCAAPFIKPAPFLSRTQSTVRIWILAKCCCEISCHSLPFHFLTKSLESSAIAHHFHSMHSTARCMIPLTFSNPRLSCSLFYALSHAGNYYAVVV